MNNTDYSKLSDFEINKLVAETLYKDRKSLIVLREIPNRSAVSIFCDLGYNEEIVSIACADYCNKPEDAWPIIYNNNITVSAPMNTDEPSYWLCYDTNNSDTSSNDKNSLRAAMIVFLKMQESQNISERMLNNLESALKIENFDTYE